MLARVPRLVAEARSQPAVLPLLVAGRFEAARRAMRWAANRRAGSDEAAPAPASAVLREPRFDTTLAALRRDGIAHGLRLRPDLVTAIRAFAESGREGHGGADWSIWFRPEDRDAAEARHGIALPVCHFDAPDRDCPEAAAVARDPWLRALAIAYLGAAARLIDVRLWWSFPAAAARREELGVAGMDGFHYDLGDWGQMKAFFHLTDVGAGNGPHRFVRGSHRGRRLSDQLSPFSARRESQIVGAHGPDAIIEMTGPAGSGFVEDPFGYHTGTRVRDGARLMLEVSYGVTNLSQRPHLRGS